MRRQYDDSSRVMASWLMLLRTENRVDSLEHDDSLIVTVLVLVLVGLIRGSHLSPRQDQGVINANVIRHCIVVFLVRTQESNRFPGHPLEIAYIGQDIWSKDDRTETFERTPVASSSTKKCNEEIRQKWFTARTEKVVAEFWLCRRTWRVPSIAVTSAMFHALWPRILDSSDGNFHWKSD